MKSSLYAVIVDEEDDDEEEEVELVHWLALACACTAVAPSSRDNAAIARIRAVRFVRRFIMILQGRRAPARLSGGTCLERKNEDAVGDMVFASRTIELDKFRGAGACGVGHADEIGAFHDGHRAGIAAVESTYLVSVTYTARSTAQKFVKLDGP